MRLSCSVMSGLALLQLLWSFTRDCCPGAQDDWHVFRHHFYVQGWKEGLCQHLPHLPGKPMIAPRSSVRTGSHYHPFSKSTVKGG